MTEEQQDPAAAPAAPAPDADGLRDIAVNGSYGACSDACFRAADLIEQQARELSELREPIHEASGLPKATCPCGWCQKERAAKDAEILRLQHEVSNRNRRALDGDEYKAAFDAQYDRAERAERDLSDTHPRIVALESQLSAARAAIAAADAMRREGSDGYNDGNTHLPYHLRLTLPTDDPYILAIREYDRLRAAMGGETMTDTTKVAAPAPDTNLDAVFACARADAARRKAEASLAERNAELKAAYVEVGKLVILKGQLTYEVEHWRNLYLKQLGEKK